MQIVPVKSTAIRELRYDETSKVLTVEFVKGGWDSVRNVSQGDFDALCAAPSVGIFYNLHFKAR